MKDQKRRLATEGTENTEKKVRLKEKNRNRQEKIETPKYAKKVIIKKEGQK